MNYFFYQFFNKYEIISVADRTFIIIRVENINVIIEVSLINNHNIVLMEVLYCLVLFTNLIPASFF